VHEALFGTDVSIAEQQMIQIATEMQMYRGSLPPAAEVCACVGGNLPWFG